MKISFAEESIPRNKIMHGMEKMNMKMFYLVSPKTRIKSHPADLKFRIEKAVPYL